MILLLNRIINQIHHVSIAVIQSRYRSRAVVLYPLAHSIQRDLHTPGLNLLCTSWGCIFFLAEPHHWKFYIKGFAAILHGVFPYVRRCYVACKYCWL